MKFKSVFSWTAALAAVLFAGGAQAANFYTQTSTTHTGGGCYISTSANEADSYSSAKSSRVSISRNSTGYLRALPDFGYKFSGWNTSSSSSTYTYTTPQASFKAGNSGATYYAHFTNSGVTVKDINLAIGDSVTLYFYNTGSSSAFWSARVNSTLLTSTTATTPSGAVASYKRSRNNQASTSGKDFNIVITAGTKASTSTDQLTIQDYNGNVYHYRITVSAKREIYVGNTTNVTLNSFATKAWKATEHSDGCLSVALDPTTASQTVTATFTGVKANAAAKYMTVANYASSTSTTGALGDSYNLYVTVSERPSNTYYANVATEVANQDASKDHGIGWTYASRSRQEYSSAYSTIRSKAVEGSISVEVPSTESYGDVDGFYIFAFPNPGYRFAGWTRNGTGGDYVSTDPCFDTSLSVRATSTSASDPTLDVYYAHFVKDDSRTRDLYLAVGDSVKLSFRNAEKAYTWSFQALWTNETQVVKEQVLNLDGTETGYSDSLAYTRSCDNATAANAFSVTVQALSTSRDDFDQLTIQDSKGNVYHYRIHVGNPRIIEKGATITYPATSFASQAWSVSNVNVAVASALPSSTDPSDAIVLTSTGAAKGQMTFRAGNYAAGSVTGAEGVDYAFVVNVVEPWPVDFCQGDSVVIYYYNPDPKYWYLLINGQRFEVNEEGVGDRMRVTLFASDPVTDQKTEILGTTTNCVPDGASDLVIVTDSENFYAYRMSVSPRRVIEVGESTNMVCSTVATHPWRVQVPDRFAKYVDTVEELNINGGHSAKVTMTGKEPKQDVTIYVANFKDDGTTNAQGAYYTLVTDVTGAPTRSAVISQGVTVSWGEPYEHATGSTVYSVDPTTTNRITASVVPDGATGALTTLSVAPDAKFGDLGQFTVTDGDGRKVVKYDVTAYVPMSMAVGQIAPGCLTGSPTPWTVWSSDNEKLDVSAVLYNQLHSGRVEAKAPGDFWLWATNASDTVGWYAMRALVYDVAKRGVGVPVNGTQHVTVSAQTGLAAAWTLTESSEIASGTLDSEAAADSVGVTIEGGAAEGLCEMVVKNAFHQETLVVYVGADNGQTVVLGEKQTLGTGDRPYLPSDCSTEQWTASSTDPSVVDLVAASGSAGTRVQLDGKAPGTAKVVVKTASKITVYEVEVSKLVHRLDPVTVGIGYTLTTNLTDISSALAGATLRTTGDRMIAETSISGGKLIIVGKQDGTTDVELTTATTVYTLPIIVHERHIVKTLTLYVGADGTASTYSYTFDDIVSWVNKNPNRVSVTVEGRTMTITPLPNSDGLAQVELECFVDGLSESSFLTYGITVKDVGAGMTIQNFDEGFIAYKDASRVEMQGDELLMVFDDVNKVGNIKIADGYNAKADILAVGGGGGGGSVATGFGRGGGGGGAGGFSLIENKKMVAGSYGVIVGEGGIAIEGSITGRSERGAPGGSSIITNSYGYVMVMGNGGGGGGAPDEDMYAGEDGGSGGGGSWIKTTTAEGTTWVPGRGGIGIDGQGCSGGTPTETNCGGGGGGAGGNGGVGQTRGPGRYSSITGSSVQYSLGGYGGRSDTETRAAAGQGPGFGGDGGNGGPGGDGHAGTVVLRFKRLYKNVLVPLPTTNDLVTSRFEWADKTNCVPFNYIGRSFRSKSDSHVYDWADALDTITGTTNVVCEYGGEGDTNKIGIGYYNFYLTLKDGFAWEDGSDPYGSTKKMSYRWVIVENWENVDAALNVNKTVWWSDKSNATVRVISTASPETSGGGNPRVLFLGTLCGSHGLSGDVLNTALNAITVVGDVDCYLYNSTTTMGDTNVSPADPPYFTTNMVKGMTINKTDWKGMNVWATGTSRIVDLGKASGNHDSMSGFYHQIYAAITNGVASKYDYILFSFDRSRLAERFDGAFEHEAEVAAFLAPYYAKEKVIWLVDNADMTTCTLTTPNIKVSPWFPANLSYYNGGESLDKGVAHWSTQTSQNNYKIALGWVNSGEYAYVGYNALVGLMCPSNYPVDKATYMDHVIPDASSLTYENIMATACPGITNQCVYNNAANVSNLIASAVKVKPFNLYYQDKIVMPAQGLTIQSVAIHVCTKGENDTPSTNETDWVALRHWDAKTGLYYDDDPTHKTGIPGSSMEVDTVNNLVTACLSNISFKVWVRYDTHVLDADGIFCSSEDAKYNESTGQYEKNPNDGQAYLSMVDELGVGIGVEGDAETEVPWRYTAYPIVGSAQNGSIFVAGSRSSQMSCAEGRDITVYYRGNGGYSLTSLTVDGNSVPIGGAYDHSYTFYNLNAAHSISVVYTPYYGTVETIGSTNEYDGAVHVPTVLLKGWDETYSTQIRYSLTPDGEYYSEAEFRERYASDREVTCVGDHVIYCRAYAWQAGYGESLDEEGWVWVDTRVVEQGVITITPKPLALTAVSFKLEGEEAPEPPLDIWYGVTVSGLVEGDEINTNDTVLTFSCPDYQQVEGQYPIWPAKTEGTTDYDIVGTNYTLSLLPGVVSVKKGPMIIGGVQQFAGLDPENPLVNTGVDRVEKIYDGVATNLHLVINEPGPTVEGGRRVYYSYDDGENWTTTYEPDKFLGVGTNKVWYAVEAGVDYESSVFFWVTNYNYVIINKRPITITAASASKRYDTLPLTTNDYAITSGSLAEGDVLVSVQVVGSQTDVGSSENVAYDAVIRCDPNGVEDSLSSGRTDDYEITYADGTLTVTPGAISIGDVVYIPGSTVLYGETGVEDVEKMYDGLGTNIVVHVTVPSSGYELSYTTNALKDASLAWSPELSLTNAGTYVVYFLVEADNYAPVTNYARVVIHPRPVTVKVQDNQMKLGSTTPEYTAVFTYTDTGEKVPDEIASQFDLTIGTTNSEIVVGTYDIVAQGETRQGNYELTFLPGELTVTDKDFILYDAPNLEVPYDGKGHTQGVTVDPGVTGNVTVEYALSPDGPWSDSPPTVTNATTGVAVYFKINSDAGTYLEAKGTYFITVNPLPVTVTAQPIEIFDKDPMPPLTAVVTGTFAEGEGEELITYDLSVSSMAIGTNKVVVSGLPQQGNYVVTYVNADFIVKDWAYPAGPEKETIPVDREWIKEQLGTNDLNYATASNFYYSEGKNGVTNWMNYVLGLEPNDIESVIYVDIEPNLLAVTNPTLLAVGASVREMPLGNLTNVFFRLLRSTSPTGTYYRIDDAEDGRFPQLNVPAEYFRVDTRFIFK